MSRCYRDYVKKIEMQHQEEMCIVVDENDSVIGSETKWNCHLNENIEKGLLHRGFAVVLFNTVNKLLLQERADTKYICPGTFSDSCSGHPLYEPLEMEEIQARGVRRAAQRCLHAELGIPFEQIPLEDISLITRMHYKIKLNEVFGEHEIGYLLFMRKDVTLNPDPKEVKGYCYVTKAELKELLNKATKGEVKVSGWFRMIVENILFQLWDSLPDITSFFEPEEICQILNHE